MRRRCGAREYMIQPGLSWLARCGRPRGHSGNHAQWMNGQLAEWGYERIGKVTKGDLL